MIPSYVSICRGCTHAVYCATNKYIDTKNKSSLQIKLLCRVKKSDKGVIRVETRQPTKEPRLYNSLQDMIENCEELTLEDTLMWTKFIKENKI